MVVGNLHVAGISILPDETDAVLVVDSDAVLPLPRAFQGFQAVARNRCQIAKRSRLVQMHELTEDGLFDGPKLLRRLLLKYLFGFSVAKRLNHELIVYRYSVNCKANDSSCRRKVIMSYLRKVEMSY